MIYYTTISDSNTTWYTTTQHKATRECGYDYDVQQYDDIPCDMMGVIRDHLLREVGNWAYVTATMPATICLGSTKSNKINTIDVEVI